MNCMSSPPAPPSAPGRAIHKLVRDGDIDRIRIAMETGIDLNAGQGAMTCSSFWSPFVGKELDAGVVRERGAMEAESAPPCRRTVADRLRQRHLPEVSHARLLSGSALARLTNKASPYGVVSPVGAR